MTLPHFMYRESLITYWIDGEPASFSVDSSPWPRATEILALVCGARDVKCAGINWAERLLTSG